MAEEHRVAFHSRTHPQDRSLRQVDDAMTRRHRVGVFRIHEHSTAPILPTDHEDAVLSAQRRRELAEGAAWCPLGHVAEIRSPIGIQVWTAGTPGRGGRGSSFRRPDGIGTRSRPRTAAEVKVAARLAPAHLRLTPVSLPRRHGRRASAWLAHDPRHVVQSPTPRCADRSDRSGVDLNGRAFHSRAP